MRQKTKKFAVFSLACLALVMVVNISNLAINATALEDSKEENDTVSQSRMLYNYQYYSLYQGDDDWFNTTVGPMCLFRLKVNWTDTIYPMNVSLYYGNLTLIESIEDYSGKIVINRFLRNTHNLYIKISGHDMQTEYGLFIETPNDDTYEPNNDFANAAELTGNYYYYQYQNDDDYYKVYANNGDWILFDLFYNTTFGTLDIKMYDTSLTYYASATAESNGKRINMTVYQTGYYYYKISGPNKTHVYDMDVWINQYGDHYEVNNFPAEAKLPTNIGSPESNLSLMDDDFYKLGTLNENEEVLVQLYFDPGTPIELGQVYWNTAASSWYYTNPDSSYANGYLEILITNATTPDNDNLFYVSKIADNTGWYSHPYTMNITINVLDDQFEENDIPDGAPEPQRGTYFGDLVLADDDFYTLSPVFSDEIAHIDIWFDAGEFVVLGQMYYDGNDWQSSFYDQSYEDGHLTINFTGTNWLKFGVWKGNNDYSTPIQYDLEISLDTYNVDSPDSDAPYFERYPEKVTVELPIERTHKMVFEVMDDQNDFNYLEVIDESSGNIVHSVSFANTNFRNITIYIEEIFGANPEPNTYYFEINAIDSNGNEKMVTIQVELISSTKTKTNEDASDTNAPAPFGEIPGYPLEIVVSTIIITAAGILINKRRLTKR